MAADILFFTDTIYKDANPMQTVEHIRNILATHNIKVSESWNDSKVPYCHSLRVHVNGCCFGVNGKGLTRELALASAYGELMERLQLGYLGDTLSQKTDDYASIYPTSSINAHELYALNPARYERICNRASLTIGHPFSAKEIFLSLANKDGQMNAVTFVDLSSGKQTLFPEELLKSLYSANGCAAGNTPEEAIVQAISETVERHHQMRILDEQISLPNIPESVLERYPVAYNIITYLRNQGFRVLVRDASLETGFPVVCLYIIDPKTGRYHTHFGAYPIFEIALNRTLTESFQGRDIEHICQHSSFYASARKGYDINRISMELVKGSCEKPLNFFVGECSYSYDPNMGFSGENNKTLLRQCLNMFVQKGLEVLVRDSSALGFPTYQVIIPGYSEVFLHRLDPKLTERKYAANVRQAMSNPHAANIVDFVSMVKHLAFRHEYQLDRLLPLSFSKYTASKLDVSNKLNQQLAYCAAGYSCYELRQLSRARECLQIVLSLGGFTQTAYASCLYKYLQLFLQEYPEATIRQALTLLCDEAAVQQLYDLLERGENLFAPLVLCCEPEFCNLCPLKQICNYEKIHGLITLIQDSLFRLDPIAFQKQMQQLIR